MRICVFFSIRLKLLLKLLLRSTQPRLTAYILLAIESFTLCRGSKNILRITSHVLGLGVTRHQVAIIPSSCAVIHSI